MEVNKLESREVLVMLFGLPVMITIIVLCSIGVGHWVTVRSDRPTNVTVSAATPRIDVNVPQSAAPAVHVQSVPPKVDVNVPQMQPPNVNITTPPAVVTVLDRRGTEIESRSTPVFEERANPPAKAVPAAEPPARKPAPEPAKAVPAPEPKSPAPKLEPVKASSSLDLGPANVVALPNEEELTLETLYRYAEKYIESYCFKNSLDPAEEGRRWNLKWRRGLEQAVADNTDTDEQTYINRIVMNKRECFDIEKATPEKIVEGCRIMLRYRDGKLAWLKAMKDAVTNENLKKTLVFLAAGVR